MKIKNMLSNFGHNNARLLGIEVKKNSLRCVVLTYIDNKYQVEACLIIPISGLAKSNETVVKTLKKWLQQGRHKIKNIAIALPYTAVIFKQVKVDASLSEAEITEYLRFNISEHTGEPSNELSFDYQVVERLSGPPESLLLQVVAARRELIRQSIGFFKDFEVNTEIIDIDIYAIERAVRWQLDQVKGLAAIFIIEFGVIFTMVIDSEKIVHLDEKYVGEESLESIEQIGEQVAVKLRELTSLLSRPLNTMLLAGEKSLLQDLCKIVKQHVEVDIMLANPFLGMMFSSTILPEALQQMAPMMLVSCGLALRVARL